MAKAPRDWTIVKGSKQIPAKNTDMLGKLIVKKTCRQGSIYGRCDHNRAEVDHNHSEPEMTWHDVSDRAKKSIIRLGLQAYKGNLTLQETNQQHA